MPITHIMDSVIRALNRIDLMLLLLEMMEEQRKERKKKEMSVVTMRKLLEAGVHYGHQTRRWDQIGRAHV